ncbi:MAG: hypothetical protein O7I42_20225 [Alphaproteobacteria bacterium]|nr:hypothetical protein [Alphaproteobacteria bacterium]
MAEPAVGPNVKRCENRHVLDDCQHGHDQPSPPDETAGSCEVQQHTTRKSEEEEDRQEDVWPSAWFGKKELDHGGWSEQETAADQRQYASGNFETGRVHQAA